MTYLDYIGKGLWGLSRNKEMTQIYMTSEDPTMLYNYLLKYNKKSVVSEIAIYLILNCEFGLNLNERIRRKQRSKHPECKVK